jgi:hypothetical protein
MSLKTDLSKYHNFLRKETRKIPSYSTKMEQITGYFSNYTTWGLRNTKEPKNVQVDNSKDKNKDKKLALLNSRMSKKNVSDVNLVEALTDDKLEKILAYLGSKKFVSKSEFFEKTLEILGNTDRNLEILENAYEMVDLEDLGYIKQANFVDF